jgi:hypothetical protein
LPDDGRLERDTDGVEKAIRPIPPTRQDARLAGSTDGAKPRARIASPIRTCKRNGVNPEAGIAATLRKIPRNPMQRDIVELTPWNFREQSSRTAEAGQQALTFDGRIEEVLQSHHFRSGEDPEATLHRSVRLCNQQLPQSALGSTSPLQAVIDWHNLKPQLFGKQPYHLPGCDTPHVPRLVPNAATVERLGVTVERRPRGTPPMRDELAGWLEGMQRYSSGGSDRTFWLEAFAGRGFTVERMGRAPLTTDRLTVGVVGGISPTG